MRSAGFPPHSPFIPLSSLKSLGSRPTKQLASMGIPACSHQNPISPIALSFYLTPLPHLPTADPSREEAVVQLIFSLVVPLSWCLFEAAVMLPLMYEVRGSEQRRQLGVEGDLSSAAAHSPALLLLPSQTHCGMQGESHCPVTSKKVCHLSCHR